MVDKVESIFDHDMDVRETEILNPTYQKSLYILFAPPVKILSDLHLLFLIRGDREECKRIMNKLRNIEELVH